MAESENKKLSSDSKLILIIGIVLFFLCACCCASLVAVNFARQRYYDNKIDRFYDKQRDEAEDSE